MHRRTGILVALLASTTLLVGCKPTDMPAPIDRLRLGPPMIPVAIELVDRIDGAAQEQWGPFSRVWSVAVMPDGRFFVADDAAGQVFHFDSLGNFVGGIAGGGSDLRPIDLASHGLFLFALDVGNRQVLRFTSEGVFRDVFLDVERLERRGRIEPSALAIDRDGRLAITDVANHEVVITGPFLDRETTVGEWGSFPGQLQEPRGVAFGVDGVLYVSDRGNARVQAFDRTGFHLLSSRSIDDVEPDVVDPRGIACDRWGNVFVADAGLEAVVVFSPDLEVVATIGAEQFAASSLRGPVDCAVGPDGRLFVVDADQRAILVYEVIYP